LRYLPLGISLQPLEQINCAIYQSQNGKSFCPRRINRECCCYLLISTCAQRQSEKLFARVHLGREGACFCALRPPKNFSGSSRFRSLSAVPLFTTHKQTACSLSSQTFLFLAPRAQTALFCASIYTFRAKSRSTRASSATDKNKLSHFSSPPAA
jgi:hypothetical protein